jgi:hypothetical protein
MIQGNDCADLSTKGEVTIQSFLRRCLLGFEKAVSAGWFPWFPTSSYSTNEAHIASESEQRGAVRRRIRERNIPGHKIGRLCQFRKEETVELVDPGEAGNDKDVSKSNENRIFRQQTRTVWVLR